MHASLQSLISSQKRFYSCPSHFFFLNSLILICCYIYSIRNSFWKKFVFLHNTQYIKIIQIIKMKKKSQLIFYIWISIFPFAYSKSDNNQLLTKNKWTFLSYDFFIQVKPNLLFKSKTYCWSNTCRASIVIYLDSFMKLIKFSATPLEKFKEIY